MRKGLLNRQPTGHGTKLAQDGVDESVDLDRFAEIIVHPDFEASLAIPLSRVN